MKKEEYKKILSVLKRAHNITEENHKLFVVETSNGINHLLIGNDFCFAISDEEKELFERYLAEKEVSMEEDYEKKNYSNRSGWYKNIWRNRG